MSEQRHFHVAHIVLVVFFAFDDGLDELEIPRRRLLNPPIKVQRIAPPGLIVPRLHILELVRYGLLVIAQEIVETDPEAPGLLRKEIGIILDKSHFLAHWEELFGELLGDDLLEAGVVEIEIRSQEVRLQQPNEILPVQRVVALLARDDELAVFCLSLGEEVAVIRVLQGPVLLDFRLGFAGLG